MEHNSRIQEDLPDVVNPFVVPATAPTTTKDIIITEKGGDCRCEYKFEPYLCVSFLLLLWYLTRQMRNRN